MRQTLRSLILSTIKGKIFAMMEFQQLSAEIVIGEIRWKTMNKYNVYFIREVVLADRTVNAENEIDAEKEASKTVHKYDLNDTDRVEVQLVDEDIEE